MRSTTSFAKTLFLLIASFYLTTIVEGQWIDDTDAPVYPEYITHGKITYSSRQSIIPEDGRYSYHFADGSTTILDSVTVINEMLLAEFTNKEKARAFLVDISADLLKDALFRRPSEFVVNDTFGSENAKSQNQRERLKQRLKRYICEWHPTFNGNRWKLKCYLITYKGEIDSFNASGTITPLQITTCDFHCVDPEGTFCDETVWR